MVVENKILLWYAVKVIGRVTVVFMISYWWAPVGFMPNLLRLLLMAALALSAMINLLMIFTELTLRKSVTGEYFPKHKT